MYVYIYSYIYKKTKSFLFYVIAPGLVQSREGLGPPYSSFIQVKTLPSRGQ